MLLSLIIRSTHAHCQPCLPGVIRGTELIYSGLLRTLGILDRIGKNAENRNLQEMEAEDYKNNSCLVIVLNEKLQSVSLKG